MKNVVFSEKRDIEKVLLSGDVTQDNIVYVISSFAKYNYSVKQMSDIENYQCITDWLKKHYQYYIETELYGVIKQKIESAHTYQMLESEDLIIYQSELDTILSSNDIKVEKILFALLCIAKLQKNIFGYRNGKYKFALTNIFKLARVHIPSKERNQFMHSLLNKGYINAPLKVADEQRYITYLSENPNDNEVLRINECDFSELAYVYLSWKNNGKGYTRCQECGKLIRQSKTKPRKYCEECAASIEKANSKERVRRYRERCNENLTIQYD